MYGHCCGPLAPSRTAYQVRGGQVTRYEMRQDTSSMRYRSVRYAGVLLTPSDPRGVVLFCHGRNSNHRSPRNRFLAEVLARERFASVLVDLAVSGERSDAHLSWLSEIAELSDRVTR